jgi:hypothetical protein
LFQVLALILSYFTCDHLLGMKLMTWDEFGTNFPNNFNMSIIFLSIHNKICEIIGYIKQSLHLLWIFFFSFQKLKS